MDIGKWALEAWNAAKESFGVPGALLAFFSLYLGWRLWRSEQRERQLADRLISLGDRSTEKLSGLAGERMSADLAVAKALDDLGEVVRDLPRGRGR